MVVLWALHVQSRDDKDKGQHENILYSRFHVKDWVCGLIIEGRSCVHLVSKLMANKLGLKSQQDPQLYCLQWLNESREMRVRKQVLVSLSIGRYSIEVLCVVVPMQTSHILLSRPWKFDKHSIHDKYNTYSFIKKWLKSYFGSITISSSFWRARSNPKVNYSQYKKKREW